MALKSKVVDGKTVWYSDSFGLDENTTFGSKNEIYNYFGSMGVQPGQVDPDFEGGSTGGIANLGTSNKTYALGDYTFNASGQIVAGPCGPTFCEDDLVPNAETGMSNADQMLGGLIQDMSATAVKAPRKGKAKPVKETHQCKNAYGHSYMCGPTDPRHPNYKPKQQDWMSMMGMAPEKMDPRTSRKHKIYSDSRRTKAMKKYTRKR